MKKYLLLSALIVFSFFSLQGISPAITVTAFPSPAAVDQTVTVTVDSLYTIGAASPDCTLVVNFGDGSSWQSLAPCTASPCTRTVTHTYTAPGQYTITARSAVGACAFPPTAPDPAMITLAVGCQPLVISSPASLFPGTRGAGYSCALQASGGQPPFTWTVTGGTLPPGLSLTASGQITGTPTTSGTYIFTAGVSDTCPAGAQNEQKQFTLVIGCPVITITTASVLPAGAPGQPYSRQILTSGGQPPVSFSLVAGDLPPGLSLSASGLIAGTPAAAGTYNFTISAADSCATGIQRVQQAFSLVVGGNLSVTVSPGILKIPRNMVSTWTIVYAFSGNLTGAVPLTSSQGVFMVGGRVIGEIEKPLSVRVVNGTGTISETLTIPVAVTLRAEEADMQQITYTRVFTTDGLTPLTAQMALVLGTEATAEFSINRLQLYFENQRAEITVDRNQPDLKAFVDIRFSGSGLLTGYWEVDGRVLEHVKQHLVYGAPITLATPDVPPLPTFSPGTHIIRFVVTAPWSDIPIPQALYFVTADEAREFRSINLSVPEDQSRVLHGPVNFKWQPVKWAETYLIVFFDDVDEKPVFSAYTRKSAYQAPDLILGRLFLKNKIYRWQVKRPCSR